MGIGEGAAEVCSGLVGGEVAALGLPPGVGWMLGRNWGLRRSQLPVRKGREKWVRRGQGLYPQAPVAVQCLQAAEGVIYLFASGVFN